MRKKLFISLAPLVAVTAFVVMPAVAQAVPHYYVNGTIAAPAKVVPVLSWGKLTLEPEPPVTAPTTCSNVAGAFAENPEGGGAGIGATEDFATYNCENAECPAGTIEIGGKPEEKVFQVISPPQDLPWPSVLTEAEAGTIRTESKKVLVILGCYAKPLTRAEGELGKTSGPGENELLPLAATVTCVTSGEEHIQAPKDEKGSSATSPSKLVFDPKAGTLSCAGGAFAGKTLKTLKVQGYTASEVLTTKNP